jgi:hypothetical protein
MSSYKNFTNFVIINLGLGPDWIGIREQDGSVSGFSKIPGSGRDSDF